MDFASAVTSGDGLGALNVGATGTLEFDAAVDATHGVDFAAAGGTLALGDAGEFSGTLSDFIVSDAIDLLGQAITGLSYSGSTTSGVLTVTGAGGTIAELSFAGDYTTSSFSVASDGHGGSKILLTDVWNGSGDWNLDSGNWSAGDPPTSNDPAEIRSGTATISTSGAANSLTIDHSATLTNQRGTSLIASELDAFGTWKVGGGVTATIGGLVNSGQIVVGVSGMTASTTVTAADLANTGSLVLQGNTSDATTHQATLDITGTNSNVVTGSVSVVGDADLQLVTSITTINSGGSLEIAGDEARISLGAASTSTSLTLLTDNSGILSIDGNGPAYGGAKLTTTEEFTNYEGAYVNIDSSGSGEGGSAVTFGGTFTNNGTLDIGNANLSASTTVNATTLVNDGTLVLQGNASRGTLNKASLVLSGAAAPTLAGSVRVSGDATLQFSSGKITTIGWGTSLELDGADAQILTDGGVNSALAGLTANNGTLALQGSGGLGAGRVTLKSTMGLANVGTLDIDAGSGDGGSVVTFGGKLTNDGTLDIGNTSLSSPTTVNATALANNGTLNLQGNAASGTVSKASLFLSSAAPPTLTGSVRVGGRATLRFQSGEITTIGSGASLELEGARAQILTDGGASSALSGLAENDGTLALQAGATLTTTESLTNAGTFNIEGGSAATLGGTLTNNGALEIDGATLTTTESLTNARTFNIEGGSAATLGGQLTNDGALNIDGANATATALVNNGTLVVQSYQAGWASLILSGAAASTLTGSVCVSAAASVQFGSGKIMTIGSGASLELDGRLAKVLTDGGASSALSSLTANYGTLSLQGEISYTSQDGAFLITTTSLTNAGTINIDTGSISGGSHMTLGGTLSNDGALNIGNTSLWGAFTGVSVAGLTNSGSIALRGSSYGSYLLAITGAATSSGDIDIGAGAHLGVAGSFTQTGGSTTVAGSLGASSINANGGLLHFASAVTSSVGALNIGSSGTLAFDAAVDAKQGVNFAAAGGTLALGDGADFKGKVSNFALSDAIDLLGQGITGLAYSGSATSGILTVTGSGGTIAALSFAGDYTTSSFTFASDGHGGSMIQHA